MNSQIILLALAAFLPTAAYAGDKPVDSSTNSRASANANWSNSPVEPANQGISQSDLMTTRDINREIAQFKLLSPQGREVRVATYKGRVTLRGTAASAEEKRQIEKIARDVAGSDSVKNEIEVRASIARN